MARRSTDQRGFALIAVLLITAIFFVLAATLMFQSRTEKVVAVNEHDHLVVLGHAEAGITWAQRRIFDATDMSDLLNGPDDSSTGDDNLIGLRDLSLTATSQFTGSNEGTASAIVQRDFDGNGLKNWEAIRLDDGTDARALVYVRVDDNFDDDPTDPSANDPLTDVDRRVQVTAVAEYPVFVDSNGAEIAIAYDRGVAQRTLVALFGPPELGLPAIASNDDLDDGGNTTVCGDCGSVHSNRDLTISGSSFDVCEDATASGTMSGNVSGVGGAAGSGFPEIPIPTINPYDDILVPTVSTFDTSADTTLPAGLRCPPASVTDPGSGKYFALVGGVVYKAYWDFGNSRWTWAEIDDLSGPNVLLDDCGRAPGDPNYGTGVDDGDNNTFYGFSSGSVSFNSCPPCGSAGADKTLCGLTDNDFNTTGYYQYGGGLIGSPPLPGSFAPDGVADFDATVTFKNSARWDYDFGADVPKVFSPVYGAVLWAYGGIKLAGAAGSALSTFECSAGAGCNPTVFPDDLWRVSLIAVGSVEVAGDVIVGPANPQASYHIQAVAGRDLKISGNIGPTVDACASGCASTAPAGVDAQAGAWAAHEQLSLSGTSSFHGFLLADDAIDCASHVSPVTTITGTVDIFYDCVHPPNPWLTVPDLDTLAWQEARSGTYVSPRPARSRPGGEHAMSSRLTAMDVENQEFDRKLRGYDRDQVDLFLRSISDEIGRLNLERSEMAEEMGKLRSDLEQLRSGEQTLRETLVSAQKMAGDMKQRAEEESKLIVQAARLQAARTLQEARERLGRLESDISHATQDRATCERRLRGVLEQHLTLLDLRDQARDDLDNLRMLPERTGS
jgi:cell division initiation protein